MKGKNLSLLIGIGIVGIVLMVVLTSGCVENEKSKENKTADSESTINAIKDNIKKEYDWKIIELKGTALREASENDELVEKETEEMLKNITKDELLNNADEYGLDNEDIADIKGMTQEEFEKFKNETLKPYIVDVAKENVMSGVKEAVNEFNYTIIEIKPKDEIKDIDIYLDAYSISDKVKEDIKRKMNNGTYVVIIEMDVGTKYNVAEVCDKEGRIIK